MRAMVLAAGMGTRLRPLTNDRPKALVEVGGRTMLAIALERLKSFGIREVVVNAHHHADMIVDYLAENNFFGLSIQVSLEQELLDTGGGLRKAASMLAEGGYTGPILVHNVDILSTIDFRQMEAWLTATNALAAVAVKPRQSQRQLLFNPAGELCGWQQADGSVRWAGGAPPHHAASCTPLAFCGIHMVSSQLLGLMLDDGAYSIIPEYLRLAGAGNTIAAFRADAFYWRDLGKAESVAEAAADLQAGIC